ncbi:MAG: hypothetical protein U1E59_13315 [Amaricoccus sp.]
MLQRPEGATIAELVDATRLATALCRCADCADVVS